MTCQAKNDRVNPFDYKMIGVAIQKNNIDKKLKRL